MNQELIELRDAIDRALESEMQAKRGRKGGISWWESRSPEERQEAVRRLSEARSRKAAAKREAAGTGPIDMEPPHDYTTGT